MKKIIAKLDYINCFTLIIFCFISFSHVSSMITGFYSIGFLDGHFLDWYEYQKNGELQNSLPSIYWILAAWNYIPVKIFGIMPPGTTSPHALFMWYKLGTSIVLLFSAKVFYKIIFLLTNDNFKSKIATLTWITTPLLIYSQFIYSSFEVFTVFFVLIGFYFYLLKKYSRFSFLLGIAFTFKYSSLLVFMPLVFLVEKKIIKIIKYSLVFIAPYLFEVFLYRKAPFFKATVLDMTLIKQKFFGPLLGVHAPSIHITLFAFTCVCALAYWLERNNDDESFQRWSIFLPFLSLASFFLFVNWEPSWFLILTPFLVLNTLFNKKSVFLFLVEIALYYFFVASLTGNYVKNADQELFFYGIFNEQTDLIMKNMFYPKISSWNYTMVTSCLLILSIYQFPFNEFLKEKNFNFQIPNKNLLRARFQLGVLVFIIPGLMTLHNVKYFWILFFPALQWLFVVFYMKKNGNRIHDLFEVNF